VRRRRHRLAGIVYGIHDHSATIVAFDVASQKIVASRKELGVGHHCWNVLWFGHDRRIFGVTQPSPLRDGLTRPQACGVGAESVKDGTGGIRGVQDFGVVR